MIDVYNVSHEEIRGDLVAINHPSGNPTLISEPETKSSSSSPTLISLKERNSNPSSLLPPFHNSLSGSTSSSPSLHISETSDYFLEKFADELAHITFPPVNDDLPFDAESDLLELEYLLNHDSIKDMDSILKDSDDYDDDLFDYETVNDDTYDDPFDFKEEKIKDSKILIDELDSPESSNFLPFLECDSVFYEDFYEVDALSLTNNEDKNYLIGALKLLNSPKFLKAQWRFFLALTKRTSESWMFHVSTSTPLNKLKYEGLGIPGFLKPLVLAVFVLRSQELQILSFILGIRYPNLID
ncbi:hypothetical protein Tco_1126971 [Tanacetum coccineum]